MMRLIESYRDRNWLIIITILSVLVVGLFGGLQLYTNEGHPMFPLDDSFIFFQYASRLAGGNFYSYSPQSGYSTGATSPLYVLLLTPFY